MQRFTLDGSDSLEQHLEETCQRVLAGVQEVIPRSTLQGLVLGGGYGRGEGGVLQRRNGDRPYNDLEFYVFVRGHRLWNEELFAAALHRLGEMLSPVAGVQVEFKLESLQRLRQGTVSMFSYDLVSAHRRVFGAQSLFAGCEHHLDPARIPLSEATRLLFNRCTGLLLARQRLRANSLAQDDCDFIGRNLAKMQLAMGDAALAATGNYHWSCLERHQRLKRLSLPEPEPWLAAVRQHHAAGTHFKLHPRCVSKSAEEFRTEHETISGLAQKVWLWCERRRLGKTFDTLQDYALSRVRKCEDTPRWRNWLLNLRTFGPRAALDRIAWRYPRERLFHSLPLLLWNGEISREPMLLRHVQRQLHSHARDWSALVDDFKRVWTGYG